MRPDRVSWVVLVYRVPREPSSPRIAIWRRLKSLGVGQLGDGVVALPEDARTREHLEWVADRVQDAGGTALMMRAQAMSLSDEKTIATQMASARAAEYRDLARRARQARDDLRAGEDSGSREGDQVDRRLLKRLRQELRTITRRDYFPPVERDEATAAVRDLATGGPGDNAAAPAASTSGSAM